MRWCQQRGIVVIAYGSLGGNKNKGRVAEGIDALARRHNVSSARVLLRWAVDQGVVVIPGATSREHIDDNLRVMEWAPERGYADAIEASARPRSFKGWTVAGRGRGSK